MGNIQHFQILNSNCHSSLITIFLLYFHIFDQTNRVKCAVPFICRMEHERVIGGLNAESRKNGGKWEEGGKVGNDPCADVSMCHRE